ncbi:hypothetical protein [Rhizobium sp. BK176]|uniref:hypothetical protein n=1 Tax=Rhizobium sp. BK176 TaxID=2587071 RepID=UPI0021692981|nr:hypothetical protein [Rhizobium sp. BK176]MCS4088419.1 hypothetical protein [Rhizobium sp. BK176]
MPNPLKIADQAILAGFSRAMEYVYTEWGVSPLRQKDMFVGILSFVVALFAVANLLVLRLESVLTDAGAKSIAFITMIALLAVCWCLRKFQKISNDYTRTTFTQMTMEADWCRTSGAGVALRAVIALSVAFLVILGAGSLTTDLGVNRMLMLNGVFVLGAVIDVYMDCAPPPPPSSGRRRESSVTKLRHA